MAINWMVAFREIPWSTVLAVAPSIAEGGKKFWAKVVRPEPGKASGETTARQPQQPAASPSESIAALEVRLGLLETKTAQLVEEAVSSFEVVRAITEQHSQLVHAVDVLLSRTRILLRVCIGLGIAIVALLMFSLLR